MSLNKDIKNIHESATKLFGSYSDTHYVDGDDDDTITKKKELSNTKRLWIDCKIKEVVSDTIRGLIELVNGIGNDVVSDAILEGMCTGTHRELQRMFIQENLIPALIKYADTVDDPMYTDGRNEGIKRVLGEIFENYRYMVR